MNRRYEQFQLSLEKKVVTLYMQVAIGSTGAPTISAANSKGVASISRTGTGAYTVTLQDKYVKVLAANPTIKLSSSSPASGACMVLRADAVSTAKTFGIEFLNGSFSATDLASGVTLLLEIKLKASSV